MWKEAGKPIDLVFRITLWVNLTDLSSTHWPAENLQSTYPQPSANSLGFLIHVPVLFLIL